MTDRGEGSQFEKGKRGVEESKKKRGRGNVQEETAVGPLVGTDSRYLAVEGAIEAD